MLTHYKQTSHSRGKTSPKCVCNQAHSAKCGEMGQRRCSQDILKSAAGSKHQTWPPTDPADTRALIGPSLRTVRLKSWRRWLFLSQLGISRLQDTWIISDKHYGGILWFYYVFLNVWILVSSRLNCLGDDFNVFFLWNSGSVLWTKKLHPTFRQHEGE